jgi:hypothetical protein
LGGAAQLLSLGIAAMFTIYNATLVAVMQVGVIVAGVLASGLWHKFTTESRMDMPFPASLIYLYGTIGFAIPLVWITCALLLLSRDKTSDEIKRLGFLVGVLILVALVIFMAYANVSPCFRIMWHIGGGDDA